VGGNAFGPSDNWPVFLLILRKISKIGATRCQILRLKCTKFAIRCSSAPDPAGGGYSAPPDPVAVFKGPTSKGWDGKRSVRGKERKVKRREDQEAQVRGAVCPTQKFWCGALYGYGHARMIGGTKGGDLRG